MDYLDEKRITEVVKKHDQFVGYAINLCTKEVSDDEEKREELFILFLFSFRWKDQIGWWKKKKSIKEKYHEDEELKKIKQFRTEILII